jgi:hypothetical protein
MDKPDACDVAETTMWLHKNDVQLVVGWWSRFAKPNAFWFLFQHSKHITSIN